MTQPIVTHPVRVRVGDGPEIELGTIDLDGPDTRPTLAQFFREAAAFLDGEDTEP